MNEFFKPLNNLFSPEATTVNSYLCGLSEIAPVWTSVGSGFEYSAGDFAPRLDSEVCALASCSETWARGPLT